MITDLDPVNLKIWQDGNWESKRYEYELFHDDTLLDVGAYTGEWAQRMYQMYSVKIIAIEPTDAISCVYGHQGITPIRQAAWIEDGVRRFGGNAYWTSSQLEGTQEYPCFDICKLLDQKIAILKLNVEGDEFQLLYRILKSGLQKNIRHFQIQFHQVAHYEGLYNEIVALLEITHKLDWRVPFIWESWSKR